MGGLKYKPQEGFAKAVQLHQAGRLGPAIRAYEEVVRGSPDHAAARNLLGLAYLQRGDLAPAARSIEQALALDPTIANGHFHLGLVLQGQSRFAEAELQYRHAIAAKPNDAEAISNLGTVLVALKRSDEAIAQYQAALLLNPNYAPAHVNLGNALHRADRALEAIEHYQRALALKPDLFEAAMNLGNALQTLGRHEEATALYRQCLKQKPNDAELHYNYANALKELDSKEQAEAHYRTAIELKPDHADAHLNLGMVLQALNRDLEALPYFETFCRWQPEHPSVYMGLSGVFAALDRKAEAFDFLERACALKPNFYDALAIKAMFLLTHGQMAEGWRLYEYRWAATKGVEPRHYSQPVWNGETVRDTLLVWSEQGLGDQVLYSGMMENLRDRADQIILEVDPKLMKLFARSFPDVQLRSVEDELYEGPVDAQQSMGSLGQYFRNDLSAFPVREAGYLVPDHEFAARLRARLSPEGGPVVGVSWNSVNPTIGANKSAKLSELAPLLRLPGIRFVDLQYGDTQTERETLERELGIKVERLADVDNKNDIDALAALITACDAVVTISNTTAHLAGALGKPTWVLVPFGQAKLWYWFQGLRENPWYPRLYTRHRAYQQPWAELVAPVADEVAGFLGLLR